MNPAGPDRCPECNYDLRGLPVPHRCPECGAEYDELTAAWRSPRETWWALAVFVASVSVGIATATAIIRGQDPFAPLLWFVVSVLLVWTSIRTWYVERPARRFIAITPAGLRVRDISVDTVYRWSDIKAVGGSSPDTPYIWIDLAGKRQFHTVAWLNTHERKNLSHQLDRAMQHYGGVAPPAAEVSA